MRFPATTARLLTTIIIPLLVSGTVIGLVGQRLRQPSPLAVAAERVSALYQPGDLVLLHPESRQLDIALFPADLDVVATNALPVGLDRFQRVILVRARERNIPAMRRMLAARSNLLFQDDVEGQTIELFQLDAPQRPVVDLAAALPAARVFVEPDDGDRYECPWLGDRFDCPDADWTWVGTTTETFDSHVHRCVWSHPVDGGDLVITYPDIRDATHISGWYGLTDYAVSIPDGRPVTLEIRAGETTRRFRAYNRRGRTPLHFEMPDDFEGPVELRVSARRPGVRHLCWDLATVAATGGD